MRVEDRGGAGSPKGLGAHAYVYVVLMVVLGSTTAAAAKIATREWPLALLPFVRYGLSGLCLLPFFRSFQWSAGDALTGAGHQNARLRNQALAAVLNFGENLYLIPHYGWRGAAWSSLATDAMIAALNWIVLLRLQTKDIKEPSSSD